MRLTSVAGRPASVLPVRSSDVASPPPPAAGPAAGTTAPPPAGGAASCAGHPVTAV